MQELSSLYGEHIKTLQQRTQIVLHKTNTDLMVIHSGRTQKVFLDDYDYPFKINPHFKAWLPITDVPHCYLIVNGIDKPTLIYNQPVDFWHKVEPIRDEFWCDYFTIIVVANLDQAKAALASVLKGKTNNAFIGEHEDVAQAVGFVNKNDKINPKALIDFFHYHRAYKTDYELECLRRSNAKAVIGHQAAKAIFFADKTEFQINLAYQAASEQTNEETPYGNIIALNENAAILHYMHFDRKQPKEHRSFLIDAGATFHGYAADITRTYCAEKYRSHPFNELIQRMHKLMLNTVKGLRPGKSYVDLHQNTYNDIGQVLSDFNLLNVSADTAIESGVVSTFFPHGLGHHLGMQTHDVAGFMQDENGTHKNTPEMFPALRVSRKIEARQVFTIEPGLYFIDSLLADLKASKNADMVNWKTVAMMKPFGGIRIEDNIIVHGDHNENMTRYSGLN